MKCFCQQDLIFKVNIFDKNIQNGYCPTEHLHVLLNKNNIEYYCFFWEDADVRYRIYAQDFFPVTSLDFFPVTSLYKDFDTNLVATNLITLDYFIPLPIKEDQVQADKLVRKLLNLKCFW